MKKPLALLALAFSAAALIGCGGGGDNNTTTTPATGGGGGGGGGGAAAGGGGQTLKIAADPSGALKYDTTTLNAKAGQDTFEFTNDAPLSHDFTIETSSGQRVAGTPIFTGGTKSVTANLKPGTYTFLCTVPGHAAAGMKGTLTVK
jgi:plastocyanin